MGSMQAKKLEEWFDWIQQHHGDHIALGLDRIRQVALHLGIERVARHCICVAGTNGKGSTVALITAIACAAGWRVGTYTSPHLCRFNERICLNGQPMSDADLATAFSHVEHARGGVALTYFEFTTLAALWLFQSADLDLAVLEVGLGGRLDAVNVIDSDVAVITNVAIEHTEWLGPDRETIGFEKAGIMRAQKPVVLGESDPPTSVLRHAYRIGALSIRLGCDFFYERLAAGGWRWRDVDDFIDLPEPGLRGPIQVTNAAVAVAALRALPRQLAPAAWAQGIARCSLAGRMQAAVYHGVPVVLDVSHNPDAVAHFAAALATESCTGLTHAVFSALADKDIATMAIKMRTSVDQWHVAGLDCPRGCSAAAIARLLAASGIACASHSQCVAQALETARRAAGPNDRICVFGSLYTVAEALALCD